MKFFVEFPLPAVVDNSIRGAVRRAATRILLAGTLLVTSAAWIAHPAVVEGDPVWTLENPDFHPMSPLRVIHHPADFFEIGSVR